MKNKILFGIMHMTFVVLIWSVSGLEFYDGKIIPLSAIVNIDVKENSATVNADYVFVNSGQNEEEISLSFPGYSKKSIILSNGKDFNGKLNLESGEIRKISLSYNEDNSNRAFSLNPEFLINEKMSDGKFRDFEINIKFDDVKSILSSSPLLEKTEANNEYKYKNNAPMYTKKIDFTWSDYNYKVNLVRKTSEINRIGDTMNIQVSLSNEGDKLNNLLLKDSFTSSNFEPVEGLSEGKFKFVNSEFEPYYLWEHIVSEIKPGETVSINYFVKIKEGFNLRLHPLEVFAEGELIATDRGDTIFIEASYERAIEDALITKAAVNSSTVFPQYLDDSSNRFIETDQNRMMPKFNITDLIPQRRTNLNFVIYMLILFILLDVAALMYIKNRDKLMTVLKSFKNNAKLRKVEE